MAKTNRTGNSKDLKKNIKVKKFEIDNDQLRWSCPESQFKFKTTKELEPLDTIIGQPRAIEAIRMGAQLFSKGYNIFVSGLAGTGRLTTVKKLLEEVTTHKPQTYDYCYVNNFGDPDKPRLLKMKSGEGKKFAKSMEETIVFLKRRLPKLFDEETFVETKRQIVEEFQRQERDVLQSFDNKLKPHEFVRGNIENDQGVVQPEVFPIIDEKPIQIEDLDDLVAAGKLEEKKAEEFKEKYTQFHHEIYDLARAGMKIMKNYKKSLAEHEKSAAKIEIESIFKEIVEVFTCETLCEYISEVVEFILDHLNIFAQTGNPLDNGNESREERIRRASRLELFGVNVVLDNSKSERAPVIVETTPSYTNLFGTIERSLAPEGYWKTDFTKIKAGALLKADQGYLIVNALDLFNEQGVWQALKRVLLYNKLEIQPYEAVFQMSQLHLKPEAINVNVKVIIIGGQTLYRYLYTNEKGFKKIFKVNAQFDYETARTEELISDYSRFIAKICEDDDLPHCRPDGVASIIEWATEHAGSQDRISLKFSDVADIVREAAYYERATRTKFITRKDVSRALEERRHRNNLVDEKMKHYIMSGRTMIDTSGSRVGQINGLTVMNNGILSFGKPARITAAVSSGNKGIIDIEREADMSGNIHSKGVLIISSIFRERFAKEKPLSFAASLAFEQSYGGIDGDSASCAEIYVILSSLTGIPINQNIAITGSVNQKGDVQPIGGVNEKINGFFEICQERGLTGDQGVVIPRQNVEDLMLPQQIVDANKKGKFAIYSIDKIEDGVEIMMNTPAGELNSDGTYSKGSVFALVQEKLESLRKAAKAVKRAKK
jgi:lon-related putative ATP-dependent protease